MRPKLAEGKRIALPSADAVLFPLNLMPASWLIYLYQRIYCAGAHKTSKRIAIKQFCDSAVALFGQCDKSVTVIRDRKMCACLWKLLISSLFIPITNRTRQHRCRVQSISRGRKFAPRRGGSDNCCAREHAAGCGDHREQQREGRGKNGGDG